MANASVTMTRVLRMSILMARTFTKDSEKKRPVKFEFWNWRIFGGSQANDCFRTARPLPHTLLCVGACWQC